MSAKFYIYISYLSTSWELYEVYNYNKHFQLQKAQQNEFSILEISAHCNFSHASFYCLVSHEYLRKVLQPKDSILALPGHVVFCQSSVIAHLHNISARFQV